jgi:uncharacterized protein
MDRLISWVEIPAEDFDRAVNFYNAILGLKMKKEDFGHEKMAFFPNGEGAIFSKEGFKPSKDGVIINFYVGNKLDETIEKVTDNGGTIVKGRTKIEAEGQEYFALFIDSEGNKLGLNGQ